PLSGREIYRVTQAPAKPIWLFVACWPSGRAQIPSASPGSFGNQVWPAATSLHSVRTIYHEPSRERCRGGQSSTRQDGRRSLAAQTGMAMVEAQRKTTTASGRTARKMDTH